MADSSEPKQPSETSERVEENKKGLKYLDSVQVAAIYILVCFSSLYEYAKENAGPLKLGVQTVEDTVRTVIGPVYEKFHDVPFELLKFVDRKVDESMGELDKHVPSLVKQASSKALMVVSKAPEVALAVASEVQRAGVVDTAKSVSRTVYTKYEPVAEHYAVLAWHTLNRLPLFPQVAHIVIPTASYWSDKYNRVVCHSAQRGCAAATYLPLIPNEKITKVFKEADSGPSVTTNDEAVAMSQ
ncbi:stress-related protein [Quercus suber]|uniref:stress-related protein n=1 Tax=Quercus suber TaxID=58331 RepID=UPI000CE256F4|nr:stress-related protein-like [Quercus suber]POE58159.1 stress-related protein [Quercus suber]